MDKHEFTNTIITRIKEFFNPKTHNPDAHESVILHAVQSLVPVITKAMILELGDDLFCGDILEAIEAIVLEIAEKVLEHTHDPDCGPYTLVSGQDMIDELKIWIKSEFQ